MKGTVNSLTSSLAAKNEAGCSLERSNNKGNRGGWSVAFDERLTSFFIKDRRNVGKDG